ncbi:hypothetical protein LWI28_002462 [Acer negundo]|uniref:Uncharacterized protein n=1 Tax=Acer negundo TaxID=4023 RepID=A0AAD5P3L2_ACENE|nr:hypothetical protein LWI28_002462 [Acer negundo]
MGVMPIGVEGAPSSSLTFSRAVDAFDLQPSGRRLRPSAVVFFLQSSSSSSSFSCRRRLRPSAVTTSSISRGGIYSHRDQFLQPSLSFSLGDFGLGFWSIDTGGA